MGNNSVNKPPVSVSSAPPAISAPNNPVNAQTLEGAIKTPPPPGTSLAEGFGKISHTIQDIVTKIEDKIDQYYYGKGTSEFGLKNGKFSNPLDYGLINIVKLFSSIDLCSLFTYIASSNAVQGSNFDPEKNKQEINTTYGRVKYTLQKTAYDVQGVIDRYYSEYTDFNSVASSTALGDLITDVRQFLENIVGVNSQEIFKNPELLQAFPQITIFENGINNILSFFAQYSDPRNLASADVKKALDYIDKTRNVCIAIQALSTPKDLVSFANNIAGGKIQEQLKKLDKLIDPKKIARTIKSILRTLTSIQNVCNQIISYVNLGRTIVQVCLILVFVLKIINKFLKLLAVPNIFTILGLSTLMSEANGKIVDTVKYFQNRLQEISIVLDSIFNLINGIIIKLQEISDNLKISLLNLENCDNMDPSLVSEMKDSINKLDSTVTIFKNYLDTYNNNKQNKQKTFGGYSISILDEKLTDENIPRKRRYGVALDKDGNVIVQSTPTFASDDNVIIQEVKLLLISKNLVKSVQGTTSAAELNIYEEASNYLEDPTVSIDTIDELNIDVINDDPDNEDEDEEEDEEDDSLNLNAFVNKLKGGKRLRRRMRIQMAKQKRQLADSLAKSDPNNKVKNKKVAKIKRSANEDEIKANLEQINFHNSRIKRYTAAIVATVANPAAVILLRRKIKDLKDKIKKLEQRNTQLKNENASLK